jgi:hypothetical protein
MASISSYTFNNMGNLGADLPDQTQKNVYNTKFANYTLSNYNSNILSDNHVQFALQQPTINYGGYVHGKGLNGSIIDTDSLLTMKGENERPLEKLQLFERPFLTIPYLGRGSCDPTLESQLLQGEVVSDKKSVSTIMEKSFSKYALYPTDDKMEERVKNPAYSIEESALNGWTRGGAATREMSSDSSLKNNRPSAGTY